MARRKVRVRATRGRKAHMRNLEIPRSSKQRNLKRSGNLGVRTVVIQQPFNKKTGELVGFFGGTSRFPKASTKEVKRFSKRA